MKNSNITLLQQGGILEDNMDSKILHDYKIMPNLELSDYYVSVKQKTKEFVNNHIKAEIERWYELNDYPIKSLFKKISEDVISPDELINLNKRDLIVTRHLLVEELSKIGCSNIALSIINHLNVVFEILLSNNRGLENFVRSSLVGEIIFSNVIANENLNETDETVKLSVDGETYILNGTVKRLINSEYADYYYILVEHGLGGSVNKKAVLIETKNPDLKLSVCHDIIDSKLVKTSDLVINRLTLNAIVIVDEYNNKQDLDEKIELDRLLLSASCISMSEYHVNETILWCNHRKTFDKPISDNQWVQFKFAEAVTQIELCRQLVYKSLNTILENSIAINSSSRAKYAVNELVKYISELVTHFHGVHGYLNSDFSSGFYRFGRIFQTISTSNDELIKEICEIENI